MRLPGLEAMDGLGGFRIEDRLALCGEAMVPGSVSPHLPSNDALLP